MSNNPDAIHCSECGNGIGHDEVFYDVAKRYNCHGITMTHHNNGALRPVCSDCTGFDKGGGR